MNGSNQWVTINYRMFFLKINYFQVLEKLIKNCLRSLSGFFLLNICLVILFNYTKIIITNFIPGMNRSIKKLNILFG